MHAVHRPSGGLSRHAGVATFICALFAMLAAGQGVPAAPQTAPQAVPISFTAAHDAAAVSDYLTKVSAARPGLTELIEIGRSTGNRPIYVLVVSNMKRGATIDALVTLEHPRTPAVNNVKPMKPYQGKPGQWIDGGQHGAGRIGTEACLYIIDKLISGYGTDPEITTLVDENAFYIAPAPHPDALAGGGAGAQPPEVAANGNYPEGWWRDDETPGGTGDYPASQAETHWLLEFFTNHTNILLAQSFGSGGTATFRPYARWPDSRVDARDLAVYDRTIGRKYLELIGDAVPAAWSAPVAERAPGEPAAAGRRGAGTGRGAAGTAGEPAAQRTPRAAEQAPNWRSPFNADRQTPYGFGHFIDWAYGQFGAFAMTTALPSAAGDAVAQACERAWQLEKYKASLLPRVGIVDARATVLYSTNQAMRAAATEDASAVTIRTSGTSGRYKIVQVTATIENTGGLPTHVATGPSLRGNREDVVWLLGGGGKVTFLEGSRWQRLGILQGTIQLPAAAPQRGAAAGRGGGGGRGGRGGPPGPPLSQMRQQRPAAAEDAQTGPRRTVTWLVAVDGDAQLSLAVTSQKGGTQVRTLTIQ